METPWEIFFAAWQRRATSEPIQTPHDPRQRERMADAIRDAGNETHGHLRYDLEWSLVHSGILTGRFLEAAEDWMRQAAPEASELRNRLRRVWVAGRKLHVAEEERRRVTEAVFAGSAAPC